MKFMTTRCGGGWCRWLIETLPLPQPIRISVRSAAPPPCSARVVTHEQLPVVLLCAALLLCLALLLPRAAAAARLETRFGPILYDSAAQLQAYGRSLNPVARFGLKVAEPSVETIVARHEYLFAITCARLDIELNGMPTAVRIVTTLAELREVYRHLVPTSSKLVDAFYSHRDKTIWYAQERLSRELALHEVTHAVLDHYFVQPIPVGVDELLANLVQRSN